VCGAPPPLSTPASTHTSYPLPPHPHKPRVGGITLARVFDSAGPARLSVKVIVCKTRIRYGRHLWFHLNGGVEVHDGHVMRPSRRNQVSAIAVVFYVDDGRLCEVAVGAEEAWEALGYFVGYDSKVGFKFCMETVAARGSPKYALDGALQGMIVCLDASDPAQVAESRGRLRAALGVAERNAPPLPRRALPERQLPMAQVSLGEAAAAAAGAPLSARFLVSDASLGRKYPMSLSAYRLGFVFKGDTADGAPYAPLQPPRDVVLLVGNNADEVRLTVGPLQQGDTIRGQFLTRHVFDAVRRCISGPLVPGDVLKFTPAGSRAGWPAALVALAPRSPALAQAAAAAAARAAALEVAAAASAAAAEAAAVASAVLAATAPPRSPAWSSG
jgi:hypothetical protein